MNDSRERTRRVSPRTIAVALVLLGLVIASVGGAMILRLRVDDAPSTFLVGPDVPLEAGDLVRVRIGAIECATEVLALTGANVVVGGCGGAPPSEVSRGSLSMEAYRAGVLEPNVGDGVLVRLDGRFDRAQVVAIAGDRRIRVSGAGRGASPPIERTIHAREAFLVRPSVPR